MGAPPGFREPAEPVNQKGDRTVSGGRVVKVEAIQLPSPEPDAGHGVILTPSKKAFGGSDALTFRRPMFPIDT
jgi:hypothetical protein